ncbi:MAG: TetR/AcrR family transcriptional regulator [Vulcanimicrobiaceae bacterium]
MKTTSKDGRRVRGEKSRALVLRRSMHMASVEGVEGLTMGRLAAQAAVSKGNLVALFGTKEALQLATLDAAAEVFRAKVVAPVRTLASPLKQFSALCEAWFEYVEAGIFPGGCFVYATANEYRARPGPLRDRAKHYYDLWRDYLIEKFRRAQARGEAYSDVPAESFVFEIMAYQQAANTAIQLGDGKAFRHAVSLTRERIGGVTKRKVKRTR